MKKFYLLSAAFALLASAQALAAPALKVTGKGITPTNAKLFANAENRVTGLSQEVTLENTGDVTLSPGDEGYTVTLYSSGTDVEVQTITPTVALEPGQTATFTVNWDFDFTPLDAAYKAKNKYSSNGAAWDTFRLRENVTNSNTYVGPWMDVYPYAASFYLCTESSGSKLEETINFGFISEARTLKYRIRSTGAADLNVTSIEVPVGFTVSPATLFTVKGLLSSTSDNYLTLEITADPTIATGVLSGDLIITAEGCDPMSYPLQAVAMKDGELYENFQVAGVPKGWIAGKYWDRDELPSNLKSADNTYAYKHSRSGSDDASMLITPRLEFGADGKMQFSAARISSYSSDTRMKVYWSPDRSDWQQLKYIATKDGDGVTDVLPPSGKWGTYTIDVPEGEGYIGFEGLYIFLDDVYGGKVVDVDYDLLSNGLEAPAKSVVNDRVNTVFTVSNLLADKGVAASDYTVQLLADGKVVGTAESVDIEAGAKNVAFSLGYTPHAAGDVKLTAVLTIGDLKVSASAPLAVAPETSTSAVTVGTFKNSTSANIPLRTNYYNSRSQIIYPAEVLAQYGLKSGDVIEGVKYEAYETAQKDIKGDLELAMRPVEGTAVDANTPFEIADDEILYSQNVKFDFHNGGSGNYHDFIDITFNKPFVYDGSNLLVDLRSENQNAYSSATFRVDEATKSEIHGIYKYNDTHSVYLNAKWNTIGGLPVVTFLVKKEAAKVTGTVTDSKGSPVPGTTVNYTSGEVLYSTLTDGEGKYSMEIFRPELEYTVSADNEYYPVTTAEGTVTFPEGSLTASKDIVLGDFTAERAYKVTFHITNDAAQSMENIPFTLHSDNFDLNYTEAETTLDADGNATLTCFGGAHSITVSAPGMKTLRASFGINKDCVKEFNLSEDVKAPYGLKAELQHDVFTGANDVALSWDNEVAAFYDDFEGYKPFAISFDPWTGIDGDKSAPAVLSGTYDNAGELNYGQIINPYAVEPMWDLNNYWTLAARSGRQYLGFIVRNDGKALDDMVITPTIAIGEDYTLRFFAKGSDKVNARFTVGVTEKTANPVPSDFLTVSDGNYIEASYEEWTPVSISLAAYAGKDVKIAIRCISEQGSFISMIDDVFVGRPAPASGAAKPMRSAGNPNESFVVTLDGEEVGTTTDYCYTVENVADGEHTFGVQAKYVSSVSDVVTVPLSISSSDYVAATVLVRTNNELSPEGIAVALAPAGAAQGTSVSATADSEGKVLFPYLPRGLYQISIEAKDYNPWQLINNFSAAQTVTAQLFETLVTPFNLTADPEQQGDGTYNVTARWNQDLGFADGFETYADFATGSFGGWKTLDLNLPTAFSYPISFGGSIVTFPGCSTSQNPASVAPMVFNPASTVPAMTADLAVKAPEGDKTVIFQGPQAASADKWLISPAIEVRDDYEWSFLAKSYPTYPETLELMVSEEGGDDPDDFKVIDTVSPSYEEWTQYTVPVGEYAGKSVRFAIHCISRDGFIALVDDFKVGRTGGENVSSVGAVKDYMVLLDGKTVGNTAENSYVLENVAEGSHKLGIRAHYFSGYSELAELPFTLTSGVEGVSGTGNKVTTVPGAILIDAAEGTEVTVATASGIVMSRSISDGSQISIAAGSGVYAVVLGREVHKVIVR